MNKEINFNDFRVRCSGISKILSNSRSNPQLTEKQAETLAKYRKTLDSGGSITDKQLIEMNGLIEKEENGSKTILSDTCIEYLMTEYAWVTEGMISVSKESMDIAAIKKGKWVQDASGTLLSRVDKTLYKDHKIRI